MMSETAAARVPAAVRFAGFSVAVQGALAIGAAITMIVRAVAGHTEATAAISGYGTAAWFAVLGSAVCAAGVGLFRGKRWGRGVAVMAQLVLLPVAWYAAIGSGRIVAGLALGLMAVGTVLALFAPNSLRWYSRGDELEVAGTAGD